MYQAVIYGIKLETQVAVRINNFCIQLITVINVHKSQYDKLYHLKEGYYEKTIHLKRRLL